MLFFPAIDIKEGNCVRLVRGIMNQATIFHQNPEIQAQIFEKAGARWLHIVDLNGAFAGEPVNSGVINKILKNINIPVQVGGGIRSLETIRFWLSKGVRRVILGTSALENLEMVIEASQLFPAQIIVGIDSRGDTVATDGWEKESKVNSLDLTKSLESSGVAAIIHTDISRDGTMVGPNISKTLELASSTAIPIILSGGVSSLTDLTRVIAEVRKSDVKLSGIIAGRAIYEGKVDVAEATRLCEEAGNVEN